METELVNERIIWDSSCKWNTLMKKHQRLEIPRNFLRALDRKP